MFARIFANNIKRHIHICDFRNSRLGHEIPISENYRVIWLFHEGFIFTKLHICAKFRENKTLAKISEFTVMLASWAMLSWSCNFDKVVTSCAH